MKKRITGVALALALALTSLGFAQGGPPVPDGCTFERGVTTCVVTGTPYATDIAINVGDEFCSLIGRIRVDSGAGEIFFQLDVTTTEYFGVSHVVKSQDIVGIAQGFTVISADSFTILGPCP